MAESEGLKSWRKKQKPGAIMKPSTFKKIEKSAAKSGASDPEAVAGAAYWKTAEAKYKGKKESTIKLGDLMNEEGTYKLTENSQYSIASTNKGEYVTDGKTKYPISWAEFYDYANNKKNPTELFIQKSKTEKPLKENKKLNEDGTKIGMTGGSRVGFEKIDGITVQIWHIVPKGYYVKFPNIASEKAWSEGYFNTYDEAIEHGQLTIMSLLESKKLNTMKKTLKEETYQSTLSSELKARLADQLSLKQSPEMVQDIEMFLALMKFKYGGLEESKRPKLMDLLSESFEGFGNQIVTLKSIGSPFKKINGQNSYKTIKEDTNTDKSAAKYQAESLIAFLSGLQDKTPLEADILEDLKKLVGEWK